MKKKVIKYVKSLGGVALYSGHDKTMYILGARSTHIQEKIIDKFGYNLPFKLANG